MSRLLDRIDTPADLKRLSLRDLPRICQEIRDEIIATCAASGGHLGASLGAVEIVVALHYVFDSPVDRLVWDVGHQAYAHKLITGRRKRFRTMRKEGGLSGFPERQESEHDAFGAGHASTAVSAALGMLEARRVQHAAGRVVAVVGDGALTGGEAFEGLNQAGYLGRDLLVVLNDNNMSISPNVGALSEWFSKQYAGRTFNRWRRTVKDLLGSIPRGEEAIKVIRHTINATKALITPGILFEGLGFHYIGPVDGHDVAGLVETYQNVKESDGPILVHAITMKGKGYEPAESDAATRGHGLSFFDIATGRPAASDDPTRTYTDVFADALIDEMRRDSRVIAITAAMLEGTGLIKCKAIFPDRTYDVGIAEQHAVTFAAGMACEGLRPVVAVYSTFLQRAYDQIIHDVALQKLPVTFVLDRGGLVGPDGKTHQGVFDLAYLRSIPNMVVMAPSDEREMRAMLTTALAIDGPAALRFPRGPIDVDSEVISTEPIEIGKARVLFSGGPQPDLLVAAAGAPARMAVLAAQELQETGIRVTVFDARFVKPLDEELLCSLASSARGVVTVEEGVLAGGFGSACLEVFEGHGLLEKGLKVKRLGLPDAFVTHGDPVKQRAEFGIDASGIAQACRKLLGESPGRSRRGVG